MHVRVRRVVTGHNAKGESIVLTDGIAQNVKEMGTTQLMITDLWETTGAPASNEGTADAAARPVVLEPPPSGSVLRFVEFPPDSVWKDNADLAAAFASIGGSDTHDPKGRAFNHRTQSVDYIIILRGEITCVLDEGEAHLKAGDVLIQRGTNHSWSVRGKENCLLCAVLISANPLKL